MKIMIYFVCSASFATTKCVFVLLIVKTPSIVNSCLIKVCKTVDYQIVTCGLCIVARVYCGKRCNFHFGVSPLLLFLQTNLKKQYEKPPDIRE
jgi:hypothetical protein